MRTLTQIVSDIKTAERVASRDLELIPTASIAGHQMAIREAKDSLVSLKAEYARILFQNASGFFIQGPRDKAYEFAAVAAVNCQLHPFSPEEMYRKLANSVETGMGPAREFNVNQLSVLIRELRELAEDLGIKESIAAPGIREMVACPTTADVMAYIKKLVQASSGNELMVLFARKVIAAGAMAAGVEGQLKVAVLDVDQSEAIALKPLFKARRIVNVSADNQIDASFAIETIEGKKVAPVVVPTPLSEPVTPPATPEVPPVAPEKKQKATKENKTNG